MVDNFSKYSDKTAPYNKCLVLITPTDVTATKAEAPPDNNCKNTICEAPPKIMIDIANTKYGSNPSSIPIAPQIIPNGITDSMCGATSNIPLVNNFFFDNIYLIFIKNKLCDQYKLVF